MTTAMAIIIIALIVKAYFRFSMYIRFYLYNSEGNVSL